MRTAQRFLTRTQEAYERLRSDVLTGRCRAGEQIKIAETCARLSVSLGAVREALSRLTSEGLVVAAPQRGFRVAPMSVTQLNELLGARIEIEAICLRRAIAAGDIKWESELVAAFHRLKKTCEHVHLQDHGVDQQWAQAHGEFHKALLAACDNSWLLSVRDMLYAQTERYRNLGFPGHRDGRDIDREHEAILKAALARDSDVAVALLQKHFKLTATHWSQEIESRMTKAGVIKA